MAKPKRKKTHRCTNHPGTNARGRCIRCGAWICSACSLMSYGQLFCKDTCATVHTEKLPTDHNDLVQTIPAPIVPQPSPRLRLSGKKPSKIVTAAACVLGIGGLLFGLYQYTQNHKLRMQVYALEHDRDRTIELLQEKMSRITELKEQLHSALTGPNMPVSPTKIAGRTSAAGVLAPLPPLPPLSVNPDNGLPLTINNGTIDKKLVALTFDGSSYANVAADILDTLRSRNVAATMFVTGEFIKRFPELVKRIVAEGHEIGNHTNNHPHLTSWEQDKTHTTLPHISSKYLCDELRRTAETFHRVTGAELSPLWRAPYGEVNGQLCRWAQSCGYVHVGWRQGRFWRETLDSNDWIPDEETPGYHSPKEVYDKITGLAKLGPHGINGGIILLHLGTLRKGNERQVHFLLGKMIDDVRALGYEFVTVSELLRQSDINITAMGTSRK